MEMNHFGHEHPLILKDMRKGKEKCRGCEERISASEAAYECGKCVDYFLHKTCGELPRELNYPNHIHAHSLVLLPESPYGVGGFVCDVCGESFRDGFTYHCSLCKFDLDISCAVWLGGSTDMNHFLHKHPLILKEDVRDYKKRCRGCDETILPWEPAYGCGECEDYILHKRCGEVPREMKHHPKHDDHTLILLPYSRRKFLCNECGVNLRGFSYHCSLCEFNLDISCAVWPWERRMEIHHFSHQHPLILNRSPKAEFESRRRCRGCRESIYGREMAFRCGECEDDDDDGYILHKECAQLAREIMHPFHYQHPLILQSSLKINCSDCLQSPSSGWMYYCSPCQFALHIECVMKDNYIICASKDRNLRHKGHDQQHSLILQLWPALLLCNACGLEKKDRFYTCSSCPFMIHRSCALLPETNKCKAHDPSCDLTLSYGFPSQHKNFKYDCDVCRKRIYDWYWIYYCGDCRYFVHLGCITTEAHQIEVDSDDDLFDDASFEKKLLKVLLYDDLLCLPAVDISKELIGRFLLRKNSLAHIQPQIEHFGHKQHPLILFHELPNDIEEDEEILCNCCIEPISSDDYYSCVECSYFLHLSCAKLPNKLQHPSHQQHSLTLGCHEQFYDTFECDKCKADSNGFFFKCETCKNFYLDVRCAAMPNIIEHKSHGHPLICRYEDPEKECNACGEETWPTCLDCESCELYLHERCAMLPGEIRHRFDPHPLLLRFPPYKDHPEIFMCAICEYEIHPKHWLYHCSECDNSFHPFCVPRLRLYERVKFGGILKVNSHPHPLKFVQQPRVRNNCNHCSGELLPWEQMLFECEDCRFSLCLECVREMS